MCKNIYWLIYRMIINAMLHNFTVYDPQKEIKWYGYFYSRKILSQGVTEMFHILYYQTTTILASVQKCFWIPWIQYIEFFFLLFPFGLQKIYNKSYAENFSYKKKKLVNPLLYLSLYFLFGILFLFPFVLYPFCSSLSYENA